jgi:flagellar motor switch protein FliN/FliY
VGAPGPSWSALGRLVLRGAGIEQIEEADARNTYLEILSQSLSGLAQTLSSRLATEVTCAPGSLVPEPSGACKLFEVQVHVGASALPALFMALSAVILDKIARPPDAEAGQAAADSVGPSQSAKTLDLLMEVELPVSVSFGRARLPLKDLLKLTTGSIVELNRAVTEPVEVIINNCVIARGEVVMVEGNYGVRIQEILSRQERLRTLK